MKRKYLEDLGIEIGNTPYCWRSDNDDKRQVMWKKEREKYGFDSRETWSLDYTFYLWLYERLMMFNELNVVDTEFHKFEYNGEALSMQDCIDKILNGLKYALTHEKDFYPNIPVGEYDEKTKDILPLFSLIFNHLWW